MKKRLLPIILLGLMSVSTLVGCNNNQGGGGGGGGDNPPVETVSVTGVTLNKTEVTLDKGGTESLVATVAPENATNKGVSWSSSAAKVATVKDGLVTAVDYGSATITVTTSDGGFTATCTVTVTMSLTSLSISNKEELATMEAGQNKALELASEPEVNFAAMIANKQLSITSSNKEVATTNGLNVYALAAGTTTIKVELFGKSDSFELTVSAKATNKERFGTDHEGTAEDPFTNEDAIKAAKIIVEQELASDDYYVVGKIASFYHAPGARDDGLVSYFLEPATAGGEKFEIYKCIGADGKTPLTDDDIWVGGTAVAHGKFTVYNTQYETSAATFVSCEGDKPQPRTTINATLAEVLAANALLADGADTYDYYKFQVYASVKQGNNFYLTAAKGEELVEATYTGGQKYYSNAFEIYNASTDVAALLTKGAKVEVTSVVKNYHGQAENLFALKVADISVLEEGEAWEVPQLEKLTVAQALAKIEAIPTPAVADFGEKTSLSIYVEEEKEFAVTGIVVAKGETWTDSSKYKNADFYIADVAGEANARLQVFRYADKAVFDSLVVDTTYVEVSCKLCAYFKLNNGEVTLAAKETNAGPSAKVVEAPVVINYGTQEAPLTVEQAKAIIDLVEPKALTTEEIWVEGIVSEILSDSYGHKVFWLASSDGATARFFEGYQVDFAEGVDAAGLVVGVKVLLHGFGKNYNGTYEVTSYKDGDGQYVYPLIVAISAAELPTLTGITLNRESAEMTVGDSLTLTATPVPSIADLSEAVWASNNEAVATVANGVVNAVAAGEAKITITCGEISAECAITVKADTGDKVKYAPYVDEMTAGKYVIGYNGKVAKAAISSNRLGYIEYDTTATITEPDDLAIWEFANTESGWTIYNASAGKYMASTGTKNQAALVDEVNDKAYWTVTMSDGLFEIENIANKANSINSLLRNNNTYGFATYSSGIGGALSLFKLVGGEEQVTVAQPVATYLGTTNVNGSAAFIAMAFANGLKVSAEFGSTKFSGVYTFNEATGEFTIAVGDTIGNITGKFDAENNKLINVGVDGAAAALVENNGEITLNCPELFFDCEGSSEQLNAALARRIRNSSGWEATLTDVASDTENVAAGKGAVTRDGLNYAVGLTLRNDFAEAKTLHGVGFWVYNPSDSDITLRTWTFAAKGYGSSAEIGNMTAKANGWTFCRMGFNNGSANIYNINVCDFTGSGVKLAFDNFFLY